MTRFALICFLVILSAFTVSGCDTIAGVGRDITNSAEWTKGKISGNSTNGEKNNNTVDVNSNGSSKINSTNSVNEN